MVVAPHGATEDRGDLALVPYYTVRDQWVTGIHIVNTSDHTQVVKFRFRRATDGMDALDFNVVMSPRDVYAGFLSDDENGNISWSSPDSTCTAPATQANRLTTSRLRLPPNTIPKPQRRAIVPRCALTSLPMVGLPLLPIPLIM